ncbi:MAG: RNA polymerase sigma-70 factor [Chitinophagaceae bacterium]
MLRKTDSYKSFKADFHLHYAPLCQYANGFLDDLDAAEDVVQDVFLKVWERKQDLLGKTDLRYYLYVAVRNNCISRKRDKMKTPVESAEVDWNRISLADEKQEKSSNWDAPSVIKEALARLPKRCREVFILSRVSQLTYQRIAETMGISVKTVENQMGKAFRILKSYGRERNDIVLLLLIYLYKYL